MKAFVMLFNKLCLVVPLWIFSHTVFSAGTVTDAKITQMYCGYYNNKNMCSIYLDKPVNNKISCHTHGGNRFQFRNDDDPGKAILSLALTAYSTGKIVSVGGKGTCNTWPDTEDLNYIFIQQ